MRMVSLLIIISYLFSYAFACASQTSADIELIQPYLRQRIEKYKKGVGIVVGIVDSRGSRIVGYGKPAQLSERNVDADTIFEIGSVTKVFTTTLLAMMVTSGEVKLEDPISKYLPRTVSVPSRDGREITLLDLATHTSGLPRLPTNLSPESYEDPYADYTVEQMYAFLSNYSPKSIGTKYEYSNYGMGLLGHILALKAGKSYEQLISERICKPLKMHSTAINLSAQLQTRLAVGHAADLRPVANWHIPTLAGAGALRSTVSDLLKFLSANLGLTKTRMLPALEMTHRPRYSGVGMQVGLGWHIFNNHGTEILWHNGTTGGYSSFVGIDKKKRRGVVVLSNAVHSVDDIGLHLLEEKYPLYKERVAVQVDPKLLDAYVDIYKIGSDSYTVFRLLNRLFFRSGKDSNRAESEFFIRGSNTSFSFVKDSTFAGMLIHRGDGTGILAKKFGEAVLTERVAIVLEPEICDAYGCQHCSYKK